MKVLVGFAVLVVMGVAFGRMVPVWSAEKTGDKPANNMEIVHEKLKADKKTDCREIHGPDRIGSQKFLAGLRRGGVMGKIHIPRSKITKIMPADYEDAVTTHGGIGDLWRS